MVCTRQLCSHFRGW